ncbi:hypothetical protein Pcinc_019584 [Petrolisthes cinctipes]|uniref:Uncharacterized protein n=1 Tax=Petrolisthes cinctipes TaxID=88211 RepID=A0AAE1FJV5_PETCI|nr:hypothetical protein Pcinc_019584 [Petrolisthes cinctipes]
MILMNNPGPRSRRTSKLERENIISKWQEGCSSRDISQASGISLSTVHRWVRRWREEGTLDTKKYYSRQWASPLAAAAAATSYSYTRLKQSANEAGHMSCPLQFFYGISRSLNDYSAECMAKGILPSQHRYLFHNCIPPFCNDFCIPRPRESKTNPEILTRLCVYSGDK